MHIKHFSSMIGVCFFFSFSYDLTPVRKEYTQNSNADNYNIDDIKSDDSTDEEDAPRKPIPDWAEGESIAVPCFHWSNILTYR